MAFLVHSLKISLIQEDKRPISFQILSIVTLALYKTRYMQTHMIPKPAPVLSAGSG